MSLHEQIKAKAMQGYLDLSKLKPNSKEIALRMINEGKLIKSHREGFYIWHETQRGVEL